MKKRILSLLLAGIAVMSGMVEAGRYTAYAGQGRQEESVILEESEKNEEGTGLGEPEDAAEPEKTAGIEKASETKQYIITMAEDAIRPEIEIAEVISEESAEVTNIQEAEQILEDAAPEEILEENTKALEENNMLLLNLDTAEAQELERMDSVEAVEEDVDMTAATLSDGDLFGEGEYGSYFLQTEDVEEWNHEMLHLEDTEENGEGTKGSGMKVAVLDSGVNLVADVAVAESVNLVDDEQSMEGFFMDGTGHGTAVAGIIGAQNDGRGITGIDPSAEIISIRILDCQNRCSLSRLIAGIRKAEELKADIICMSLGTAVRSAALEKAVTEAQEKGILLIAAAGNGGTVEYPAAYDAVISVGAVDHAGEPATESSNCEEIDLLAPGEDVAATDTFFGADYLSGTSMAAPHVAGIASLLWKKDRDMPAGFIKGLLELSAAGAGDGGAGVADYAYALSIYEEYKQQYSQEERIEKSPLQNTQEVEAVDMDRDVVEARWGQKYHTGMVKDWLETEEGKSYGLSANRRKALLRGAVLPDESFAASAGYYFHGGKYNFLAFYKFLYQMARRVYNNSDNHTLIANMMHKDANNLKKYYPQRSDGTAFPSSGNNSATGTTSGQLDKLAGALITVYNNWGREDMVSTADMPIKKTDLAMSYVILGMAIHSATDTYAHRAWVKENGKWVDVKAAYEEDKTTVVSARAEAAQITCDQILRRFHEGHKDCVAPFLIKNLAGYGGDAEGAFRLLYYQKCANEITDSYRNKLSNYSYSK